MHRFIFALTSPIAFGLVACGPGPEVETMEVTADIVDGVPTFSWDVDPTSELDDVQDPRIGALAVFACVDGDCQRGTYRKPDVDAPRWYVTGEDYSECTFPEIIAPVTYGAVPATTIPVENVAAAALETGVEHVVVAWRFTGCLAGGDVRTGRATFVAP